MHHVVLYVGGTILVVICVHVTCTVCTVDLRPHLSRDSTLNGYALNRIQHTNSVPSRYARVYCSVCVHVLGLQ